MRTKRIIRFFSLVITLKARESCKRLKQQFPILEYAHLGSNSYANNRKLDPYASNFPETNDIIAVLTITCTSKT